MHCEQNHQNTESFLAPNRLMKFPLMLKEGIPLTMGGIR